MQYHTKERKLQNDKYLPGKQPSIMSDSHYQQSGESGNIEKRGITTFFGGLSPQLVW